MRTIIAVVTVAPQDENLVNVQLFADDTKVVSAVRQHAKPRNEIESSRLETEIRDDIMSQYGVGAPHGWRCVYISQQTVAVYEYDFDNARRFEA